MGINEGRIHSEESAESGIKNRDPDQYEEIAREADASIERIARIFAEMGADAATMEKMRSIRSATDAEKEKYRKMTELPI